MGVTGLTQCWQTYAILRWHLGGRRGTLMIPFTALNTSGLSPESQSKCLRWSLMCSWTSGDIADRRLVRSAKGQLPSSNWCQWELGAPENPTGWHIFSHLNKLMPYTGRFSAEIEKVGIPSVSARPWACLPLLLAIRKSSVPKGADGDGEWDLSPATGG